MQKFIAKYILVLADILFLYIIMLILIYFWNINEISFINELNNFLFMIFIIVLIFHYEKIYDFRFDFWQETLKIFKSLIIAFFIVLTFIALTPSSSQYSRLFITIYFIVVFVTLPIFKRIIKKLLFHFDFFQERVYVIGENKEKKELIIKELLENWYLGAKPCTRDFDKVIIQSYKKDIKELNQLVDDYLQEIGEVYIIPYLSDLNYTHSNIFEYTNIRMNAIQVQNRLLIKKNKFYKTFFDYLTSILLLLFF